MRDRLALLGAALGCAHSPLDVAQVELARREVVLLRAARVVGVHPDAEGVLQRERARVTTVARSAAEVSAALAADAVHHVLPKAWQHHPDVGHDIDVLVAEAGRAEAALCARLGATGSTASLADRVAGKRSLTVPGWHAPIELHSGRMGVVGEHGRLASSLLASAGTGGPLAPDDALTVQVVQRVLGHRRLRVGDVLTTHVLLEARGDAPLPPSWPQLGLTTAGKLHVGRVRQLVAAAKGGGSGSFDYRPVEVLPALAEVAYASARAGDIASLVRMAAVPLVAAGALVRQARSRPRRGS